MPIRFCKKLLLVIKLVFLQAKYLSKVRENDHQILKSKKLAPLECKLSGQYWREPEVFTLQPPPPHSSHQGYQPNLGNDSQIELS